LGIFHSSANFDEDAFDVMPNITRVSDPVRLRSGWINGIKKWQVQYE
jgi:hypothetical protein